MISKPYGKHTRKVDSDWTLLHRVKVKSQQQQGGSVSYPVVRYYVNNLLTSWGWAPLDATAAAKKQLESSSSTEGVLSMQGMFWSLVVVVSGILSYAILMQPPATH